MIKRALTIGGDGPAAPSPFDDDFDGPGGDVAPSDFSTSKLVMMSINVLRSHLLNKLLF